MASPSGTHVSPPSKPASQNGVPPAFQLERPLLSTTPPEKVRPRSAAGARSKSPWFALGDYVLPENVSPLMGAPGLPRRERNVLSGSPARPSQLLAESNVSPSSTYSNTSSGHDLQHKAGLLGFVQRRVDTSSRFVISAPHRKLQKVAASSSATSSAAAPVTEAPPGTPRGPSAGVPLDDAVCAPSHALVPATRRDAAAPLPTLDLGARPTASSKKRPRAPSPKLLLVAPPTPQPVL